MEPLEYSYKSEQRISKILSCTLKIDDFKKLFELLKKINGKACENELSNIEKNYQSSPRLCSTEEYEKFKSDVSNSYKIHIQISGKRGEYLTSDNDSIFDRHDFPYSVTEIRFDNTFFYDTTFNRKPQSSIDIQFDFTKPPLIDFVSSPSYETVNNSAIYILGEDETWVEGAHGKVVSFLKNRRNARVWLHRKNIYDLFLFLFVIPLSLWNLQKFDLFASTYLSKFSIVLTVGIYLYILVLILNAFRFVFNYLRWLFPYLELKTSNKTKVIFHRIIFFGILSAIIYALANDLFVLIVKVVF